MLDNAFLRDRMGFLTDKAKLLYLELIINKNSDNFVEKMVIEETEDAIYQELLNNQLIYSYKNGFYIVTDGFMYDFIRSFDADIQVIDTKKQSMEFKIIADDFNAICKSLRPVAKITKRKKEAIVRCIAADYSCYDLHRAFEYVESSDFLCGRLKNSTWKANFEWVIKPENLENILDGKYVNRKNNDALNAWGGTDNG